MICPKCQKAQRDDAKFCSGCGAPFNMAQEAGKVNSLSSRPEGNHKKAGVEDISEIPTQKIRTKSEVKSPPAPSPSTTSETIDITMLIKQRDQSGLPYFHLQQLNDSWHIYFAIRLVAVTKNDSGSGKNLSEHEVLQQQFSFLSAITQDSSDIEKVIELRFIAHPDRELPQRGKIDIGFICKVVHPDRDVAIQQADTFLVDLYAMLPLTDTQTYQFVTAYTEQEFMVLFKPDFPIRDIGDIVKREEVVNIGKERELYIAYPFSSPEEPAMHRIIWKLLREPNKHILSICLMPTTLTPWERQTLRESVDACESSQTETEFEEGTGNGRLKGTTRFSARARANALGRIFLGCLHELSDKVWLLKIQIASDEPINQGILDLVGAEIAGFPRFDHEKNVVQPGGYTIGRPSTLEEFQIAQHNLQQLEYRPWLYSMAPDQLSRLRHLASVQETFRAFRIPPPKEEGIPGVELQMVKFSPIPGNMPKEGTVLGESLYLGMRYPPRIMIKDEDRKRHLYIIGKTGVGKSTLILQMAVADIQRGLGVCVVDPHGELIDDILLRIPKKRVKDVILFDPSDSEMPLGVNMLEAETEQEKHLIVNEMIGLMYKLYDPNHLGIVGPRFEHAVRNSMLTVMAEPGGTLIDVVGVLTSDSFRSAKLAKVKDPLVRSYWQDQIAHTSDFHKSEVLDYIVSKFGRFVTNDLVRNIIGQSKSAFDFRKVIDDRKILLVNLCKGKIGPENSTFLGSILVPKLLVAALSRADTAKTERHNFQLYVDEFQNFASETFATMLSEARKYGLAITMAHQYIDQLPVSMRSSVFGNVGTLISFRVGIEDGRHVAPEFYPAFSADDLANLPKFTACVKLLVDGLAVRPFSMRTLFDSGAGVSKANRDEAIHQSRNYYGKARSLVSAEIERRGSNWFR